MRWKLSRITASAISSFGIFSGVWTGAMASPPAQQARMQEMQEVGADAFTSHGYKPAMVRHIVLFQYQPSATTLEREEIKRRFLALRTQVRRNGAPYIVSIETGAQSSGEGADHGMDQAFLVTFCSEGDRNYYVGAPVVSDPAHFDPAHAAFKQFVAPYVADVVVFDYALPVQPPCVSKP